MIEILLLFIVIIVAFVIMRGRGLAYARVDKLSNKKTTSRKVSLSSESNSGSTEQKITKIKWKPHVQVREYYKDGNVADVPEVKLND